MGAKIAVLLSPKTVGITKPAGKVPFWSRGMSDKPIRRRTWTAIKILAYLRTESEPGVFSEPLDSIPGS